MDNKFGIGVLVGVMCLLLAAVWPTNELRLYKSDNSSYGTVTYDGTNLDISTGVDISGAVGATSADIASILNISASSGEVLYKMSGAELLRLKSGSLRMAPSRTITQDANGATYGELKIYDNFTGDASLKTTFFNGDVRLTCGSSGFIFLIGNVDASWATYVVMPGGCRDWGLRSTAPTSPAPLEGDRYFSSADHAMHYYNGSTWN